jgi:hypothetical protein
VDVEVGDGERGLRRSGKSGDWCGLERVKREVLRRVRLRRSPRSEGNFCGSRDESR